ncbi:MAG: hypothetical protein PHU21_00495 [Elusimicrobia bacterium]|nr:hypothetical protein [Elusimicrobiota bacterium]
MRKKGLLSVRIPGLSKSVEEKQAARTKVAIDYPQQGERVHRGHYAVRISAGETECQAAVDGSDWQTCRSDAGYSWFDWFPETAGTHTISVRARVNGKWAKAERVCDVE